MNLQSILYGTFMPPKAIGSRVNNFGFANLPRYTPPRPKTERMQPKLNASETKIMAELQKHRYLRPALEIAEAIGMTRNYCSIVLAALFKKGHLRRAVARKPGSTYYLYALKNGEIRGH